MMTPKRLARELEARLDGPHGDEHTAASAELAALHNSISALKRGPNRAGVTL